VRILFSFVGGRGHFEPLRPIAAAAAEAGHAVAFCCSPAMVDLVRDAGFEVHRLGARPAAARRRLPLAPPDVSREERELRDRFVRRAARERLPRVAALCERLRPSVVVCEETDFAASLAAETAGIPFATVLVIAAGSFVRPDVVSAELDRLRREVGLAPDPDLRMAGHYLMLSPFPLSYREPSAPLPPTAFAFRAPRPARGDQRGLALPPGVSGLPRVYFTLGTVFNLESGDLQARVIESLSKLPIDLVAAVGSEVDPAEFGSQPPNVRIARELAQSEVIQSCDLVVSHGGSGSVLDALAAGLPSVLLPIGADQPLNARRCVELGVARALDPTRLTSAALRSAVSGALVDSGLRRNAARLRDEIAALPDAAACVRLLERLARERRPVRPGEIAIEHRPASRAS